MTDTTDMNSNSTHNTHFKRTYFLLDFVPFSISSFFDKTLAEIVKYLKLNLNL